MLENDFNVGDKFGKLVIISKTKGKHWPYGYAVKCRCDCGKETKVIFFSRIRSGHIKTCGRCNEPLLGDKHGSLTVIEIRRSKTNGCSVKCKCECGNITKYHAAHRIISNHITTCGQCKVRRNGIKTSYVALKLQKVTDKILNKKGIHNANIPYVGNVDIYYPDEKIIIEYCGYVYHRLLYGDKSEKDKRKYSRVIKEGYKLLVINAGGKNNDIPSEKVLSKILLNDFRHKCKKKTITLKSWYKEKYYFKDIIFRRKENNLLKFRWTREEDNILLKYYMVLSIIELVKLLPRRTKSSIIARWVLIKPQGTRSKYKWLEEDKQYLLNNIENKSIQELSKILNRTESSIKKMCYKLNLNKNKKGNTI